MGYGDLPRKVALSVPRLRRVYERIQSETARAHDAEARLRFVEAERDQLAQKRKAESQEFENESRGVSSAYSKCLLALEDAREDLSRAKTQLANDREVLAAAQHRLADQDSELQRMAAELSERGQKLATLKIDYQRAVWTSDEVVNVLRAAETKTRGELEAALQHIDDLQKVRADLTEALDCISVVETAEREARAEFQAASQKIGRLEEGFRISQAEWEQRVQNLELALTKATASAAEAELGTKASHDDWGQRVNILEEALNLAKNAAANSEQERQMAVDQWNAALQELAELKEAQSAATELERTLTGRIQDLESRCTLAETRAQAVTDERAAFVSEVRQQPAISRLIENTEQAYAKLAGRVTIMASEVSDVRQTMWSSSKNKSPSALRQRYLDLLEATLTGSLHQDPSMAPWTGEVFNPETRMIGRDWPKSAETMIGRARMRNVRYVIERVIEERIEGDVLEAGVWRGGASIYMRGILAAYGISTKRVWVADSFEGLPKAEPGRYPADEGDEHSTVDVLAVSLDEVKANFAKYDLLDDLVMFAKGWFEDTLPALPVKSLSVLRLDGDMYSSTIQTLDALYHRVTPGGFIVVDDYILPGCRAAITDFRARFSIESPMEDVDGAAVYWRKS